MKEFSVKPKIYFGSGSLEYLSKLKGERALIVTDPFMLTTTYVNKIKYLLKSANIESEVFSDIKPDPPIEVITSGIKKMLKYNPDIIIALGGGSSIDSAKSISVFGFSISKIKNENAKKPLFIAIPTTSGTGSEVTGFSVISDSKNHMKYPIFDEELIADIAILDEELVKSVPKAITADTGIDVLTHAIEAYVSIKATDYTDALAEKSIKMVFKYLPRAYKNGDDMEARYKMHNASCMAGMAFTNASVGLNHGMAHILGGKFKIPHGRANAYLLPYVINYNADLQKTDYTQAALKYFELSKILELPASNVEGGINNFIEQIKKLLITVNIPLTLKDAGINKENYLNEVKNMAKIAIEDGCTNTNPKVPVIEDIEKLYIKAYGN